MTMAECKNGLSLIILWALVALIGSVHCKCSLTLIADDERTIAYACIHSDLNDLGALSSDTDWIEFSVSRLDSIPDDAFARFRNLKRLAFYNCNIRQIEPNAFRGVDHLEWLVFHGTRLNVAKTVWFQSLPNLRRLIMDNCGLVHVEPQIFHLLPNLETLDLRDNDLDCLPIEGLSALRMLRTVRIDGNPWICACRQRLERFFHDRGIVEEQECRTCLDVHQNLQCMTQFVIPVLPPFITQNVTFINKVHIPGTHRFETSALSSLDRLPDKTAWIQIFGLHIGTLPKYAFFRFGNSLRSLELRDCDLHSVAPTAFAGLHKLERLILIGNPFHELGADWFTDLLALQQLVLRSNHIEHIDKTAFSHLGGTLRHLDIQNNRLRCLPTETLSYLRRVERIEISENPWLCACRDILERFLIHEGKMYQIIGRCYHSENEVVHIDDRWQHDRTTYSTGIVRWGTVEDIHLNISRLRPRPTTPRPVIVTEPPQPPLHQGSCAADTRDRSKQFYTCSGLTSLTTLNSIPFTAHTIRIIRSNIKVIQRNDLPRFGSHLVRLELQDCGITKIEDHAFYELSNLEQLILSSNDLQIINAETLDGLMNLRVLNLSHNNIMWINNGVFDMLPNLVNLDISDNVMNCVSIEHLARRMPHLQNFKVMGNPWSCLCGQKIAKFLDERRIVYDKFSLIYRPEECLSGITPQMTPRPTMGFPRPSTPTFPTRPPVPTAIYNNTIEGSCTKLEDTNGTRYRCTGGNINLLKTIPPQVTAIEFHEGHLPYLPAGSFSEFYNLRELILWNCGLHTVKPGAFNGLTNLQKLTIRDNPLLTIGSNWFILPNLEMLDLRGNSVKYVEPNAFQHLSKVVYLNLEGNDLKCIFTSDLDSMPIVHTIEFSGNPLKWRCRVELEQFLEARRINYVKVENSCEGKKLVKSLLWNRSDLAENCSMGSGIDIRSQNLFMIFTFVYFCVMLIC